MARLHWLLILLVSIKWTLASTQVCLIYFSKMLSLIAEINLQIYDRIIHTYFSSIVYAYVFCDTSYV